MQCPRCLNEDPRYFYLGSKGYYCRKCVAYKRVLIDESITSVDYQISTKLDDVDYYLGFDLTNEQSDISAKLSNMIDVSDVLVYAACGAGKTEIVLASIKKYLRKGLKVGFATPRRQVVLEIGKRLEKAFSKLNVIMVCEGYTNVTLGDLIVCTTHQLYRYYNYFDLLVLDEPDAFPYHNNEVLKGIAKTSCKGNIIYLTATPDDDLRKLSTLSLFSRPHGKSIPVPTALTLPKSVGLIKLAMWLKSNEKSLVFVPTIKTAKLIAKFFKVPAIYSQSDNKDKLIEGFKNGESSHLICTTILERGVTFSNINVLVLNADHMVFNLASLIQIAGRVGRDVNFPTGKCLFISFSKTKKVSDCVKTIKMMNA